jgi:hypothetical protein
MLLRGPLSLVRHTPKHFDDDHLEIEKSNEIRNGEHGDVVKSKENNSEWTDSMRLKLT